MTNCSEFTTQDLSESINHDRLFKELIRNFFEEFIVAFFPDVYEYIDFHQTTFLSEEAYSDFVTGEQHRVDLLIETRVRGQDSVILIHIEPQSSYQSFFPQRMFLYYSDLYKKHRRPIVPIAIFSYDKKKEENTRFSIDFPFFHVLDFRFLKLQLASLNWRNYISQPNPTTAALLSKMRYKADERIQVKKQFLRMLVKLELDRAKMSLLTGFFETYLRLSQSEEQMLHAELKQLQKEEENQIMEIISSWEKKGIEKGIEKGKEAGKIAGKKEKALEIAAKMRAKGFNTEQIKEMTGLEEEEIKNIDGPNLPS